MTLNKVAEQAGVALNTARKALNNAPGMRPHLRARVQEAAKKLDYHPNLVARGLRRNDVGLVPVSVPMQHSYWHMTLSDGLSRALVDTGMEPVFCHDAKHMLAVCKSFRARGCLLAAEVPRELMAELSAGRKLVTVNIPRPWDGVPNVAIQFDPMYRGLVRRLLAEGRRRVAVVSNFYCLAREKGWPLRKFPAVLRMLEKAGLPLAGGDVFASPEAFGAWLETPRGKVDAVLCEDDMTAARVVAEMARRGLRTPRDAQVVGCDANFMVAGTWSVRLDAGVIARMAVDLLRKALEDGGAVESATYKPEVVVECPPTPPQKK